ncbi:MAG: Cobalamin-binding protein precursor [Methanoregulaceae archaeon PtaB.Bin009]|jgi:iron complex transport system substrate-binding protein|nr:MAG: Cobalamin-binding protein precursor [Methanoregulaceae archaeon PtaB.Bin009]OPY40599.1 MAG: Cobalamin-binding protein precursor [Methanoregulaceae archaeon PtaU1.Bin066]HNQ30525.1 cobalamin-binding protein [Methanolinea sp.]
MNPARIQNHHTLVILVMMLVTMVLPASAVTVTDDAGVTISLDAPPLRIVSLAPSNTEILAALGLVDRMVGVTDVCDYPPEAKQIPRIGGYSAISVEKVAAAMPDLVLASDITPKATVDRLKGLGLTVMVVSPRNIDDMMRDIRVVGTITGKESEAEELVTRLSKRIAAVARCSPDADHPTVAHVVWHDPLYVSGNDTLQNDVIIHAGGENVFSDREGWSTVPLEEFLLKNPDILIVSGGGGMDSSEKDVILEVFMTSPQYASLSAVRNNRVYAVNADIISRPAPRIVEATEQVARHLHPECFNGTAAIPGDTAVIPVKSPGFCTGSALLLVSLVFILHWKRNE